MQLLAIIFALLFVLQDVLCTAKLPCSTIFACILSSHTQELPIPTHLCLGKTECSQYWSYAFFYFARVVFYSTFFSYLPTLHLLLIPCISTPTPHTYTFRRPPPSWPPSFGKTLVSVCEVTSILSPPMYFFWLFYYLEFSVFLRSEPSVVFKPPLDYPSQSPHTHVSFPHIWQVSLCIQLTFCLLYLLRWVLPLPLSPESWERILPASN